MAKFDKYTQASARAIAIRIWQHYAAQIRQVSTQYRIPEEWLAGLTGMENPDCMEWPSGRSVRFESGVYAKLRNIRSFVKFWHSNYNGVKREHLVGLTDEALHSLSMSYGQTQIMGYYVLTVLIGVKLADLRDPSKHYEYTARMFEADPRLMKWLRAGNFAQACHIWNSGREWDGDAAHIKTWSPYYMYNCGLVAQEYAKLVRATNAGANEPVHPASVLTDRITQRPPNAPRQIFNVPLKREMTTGRAMTEEELVAASRSANPGPPPPPSSDQIPPYSPSGPSEAVPSDHPPTDDSIAETADSQRANDDASSGPAAEQAAPEGPDTHPYEMARAIYDDLYSRGLITSDQHTEALLKASRVKVANSSEEKTDVNITDPDLPRDENAGQQYDTSDERNMEPMARSGGAPTSSVGLRPGWKTSEAHLTLLFTVACFALSYFGIKVTPGQLMTNFDTIMGVVSHIGPMIAGATVLFNYITSRGKAKSNAMNANAAIAMANTSMGMGLLGSNKMIGGILGGKDWKDPARYGGILKSAGVVGLPGAEAAGSIIDRVSSGGVTNGATSTSYSKAELDDAFAEVLTRIDRIDKKLGIK
jgi:hypothetical protein